jgi:RNA polymerase sigma-70 factor (ECF subfamily)
MKLTDLIIFHSMEEKYLIQRLHEGKEDAFERVFRMYFVKLCLYAEHYVRDKHAAEDIVEDFFYLFWINSNQIIINTSLDGYIYTSIHNRCLKYLRQEKIKQKHLEEGHYIFTDKEILETASEDYPDTNLVSGELEDIIAEAINSLPEQCRKIFSMSRFDGLSYNEISVNLGISVNTVKTQMARALQKMRVKLKDYLVILALLVAFCDL